MSIDTIKEEAIRQFAIKIDSLNDEAALKMVLDFLGGIKTGQSENIDLSSHYDSIKARYSSVLEKLAQ